jgi:O-antigen/teichoic acid export membrane protein
VIPAYTRSRIIRNVFALFSGGMVAQAMMALSVLVVARQLGAEQFGKYAACFTVASLSSVLFNLGLDTWILKAGAENPEQMGRLIGNVISIKGIVGLVWCGGMTLVMPNLNSESFPPVLMLLSCLSIWLEGLFMSGSAAFRIVLRNHVMALLMIGLRGGILALAIGLSLVGNQHVAAFALTRLGVSIAVVIVTLVILPVRLELKAPIAWTATLRASIPFTLSDLLTSIYVQADVVLAALLLDTRSVGVYSPASSIVNALFVLPNAIYIVLIPVFVTRLKIERTLPAIWVRLTLGGLGVLGMLLMLAVALGAPLLPKILGASFAASVPLLIVLSPILFAKSVNYGLAAVLVAAGRQTSRVVVQAFSAFVNVSLNLLMIPYLGISGVAIVYVISEVVLLIGYMILVWLWRRSAETQAAVLQAAKV